MDYYLGYEMLARAQLCKINTVWKAQMPTKTTSNSYIFLILKDELEIDSESNICLIGKVTCKWK